MSVNVGSAVGYLDLDISKFKSALSQANTEANTQLKSISTSFSTGLNSVGSVMTSAGSTLTKTVTAPIVAVGAAAVKTTSDFDKSMSNVQALSGATGKDFDALRNKALEMGSTTAFTASQSADALGYMALAGWDTNQMLSGLEGVMNLAAAGGSDLATTSDIVTDSLTAFGMSAEESGHFADVMAKAMSKSNTSTEQLGEAFKYVAPVAGALKYSVEDVSTALGLMANVGVKGSSAGTALRQAINSMVSPTEAAAIQMEKLGIDISNADGTMKPFSEVMDILREKMGGLSEEEQAQAASTIFGTRAMSGMLGIINASESDYQKLTNEINNADGAAESMADTMLNNLSGQLTILKSALEGLSIQIGDLLKGYVSKGVSFIQTITDKLSSMSEEEKQQIIDIAAIVAIVGPALLVFGKILTGMSTMIKTFQTLKTGITALKTGFSLLSTSLGVSLGPILAIVAAIGVLVAAFVTLWKNNEEFRNKITEIWNGIKEKFESFTSGIVERLNSLGFDFENITDVLKSIWEGFCNFLAPVFEFAFGWIANIFSTACDIITGILDVFIGVFTGDWERVWNGVKEIFGGWWNGIKNYFSLIKDFVMSYFGNAIEKVVEFFKNLWEKIKEFFQNLPKNIGYFLGMVIAKIANFAVNAWKKSIEFGKTFVENVVKFFKELPGKAKEWFTKTIERIKEWAKTAPERAKEGAQDMKDAIINGIKELPDRIKETGRNLIEGLWNGIQEKVQWLKDKAKDFADGFLSGFRENFGVSSPSKRMRDEIGRWLPPGIAQGFEKALPETFDDMEDSLNRDIAKMQDKLDTFTITGRAILDSNAKGAEFGSEVKRHSGIIDYDTLALKLSDVLRRAPINNNVSVEMQDGDVIIDKERVGRKVAPVVSRVMTLGEVN